MPTIDDKMDSEEEDMEQDFPESDKSDSSFSDSADSGSDEESDLDEAESERRRYECMEKMSNLENQFFELKEFLFREKSQQIVERLEQVKLGTAVEYLEPMARLQDNLKIRLHIADIRLELRKKNLDNHNDAEKQAAKQNFKCEKTMLYESIEQELQEKIQQLKKDRHNTDITAGMFVDSISMKKNRLSALSSDRRRKPVAISGPYIVYMLKESQILEDYAVIKMALKQRQESSLFSKIDNTSYSSKYDNGRLYYENDWYPRENKLNPKQKFDQQISRSIFRKHDE